MAPSVQPNIELTMITTLVYDFPPLISSANTHKEIPGYCGSPGSSVIFGWVYSKSGHRYFNLVFSGIRLQFEAVGFNDELDYLDSWHLDKGVEFTIVEGKTYDFAITVTKRVVEIFLDGHRFFFQFNYLNQYRERWVYAPGGQDSNVIFLKLVKCDYLNLGKERFLIISNLP